MFSSLVKRVTAPFRRKRCPECGHKVRETYCDVCGYDLIEQTRTKRPDPYLAFFSLLSDLEVYHKSHGASRVRHSCHSEPHDRPP